MFDNFLSSGTLLETEHGLVMLLLLYGLLTYRGAKFVRWVPVVIVGGVLLSVFTPVHRIEFFWPVITGLVVPPFLWQGAVAVTKSGALRRRWGLALWLATFLLVTVSLRIFSGLPFSNALLISALAVTLVWYFREMDVERSYLSTFGLIALTALLVEIDLAVVSITLWFGTLVSGTAIGIAVGFIGVALFRKLEKVRWKTAFFFVWAYVAYLTGLAFDTSAIAVTLAAALVVSTYGFSIGLWLRQQDIPVPSDTPFFFFLAGGTWLLLGWQAHTSVNPSSFVGLVPALAVVTIAIFAVRKIAPLSNENKWDRLIRKESGVLLLLLGGIMFWPQEAFLTTVSVEIALVAALFLIFVLRVSLMPIFELIGVPLSWPSKNE